MIQNNDKWKNNLNNNIKNNSLTLQSNLNELETLINDAKMELSRLVDIKPDYDSYVKLLNKKHQKTQAQPLTAKSSFAINLNDMKLDINNTLITSKQNCQFILINTQAQQLKIYTNQIQILMQKYRVIMENIEEILRNIIILFVSDWYILEVGEIAQKQINDQLTQILNNNTDEQTGGYPTYQNNQQYRTPSRDEVIDPFPITSSNGKIKFDTTELIGEYNTNALKMQKIYRNVMKKIEVMKTDKLSKKKMEFKLTGNGIINKMFEKALGKSIIPLNENLFYDYIILPLLQYPKKFYSNIQNKSIYSVKRLRINTNQNLDIVANTLIYTVINEFDKLQSVQVNNTYSEYGMELIVKVDVNSIEKDYNKKIKGLLGSSIKKEITYDHNYNLTIGYGQTIDHNGNLKIKNSEQIYISNICIIPSNEQSGGTLSDDSDSTLSVTIDLEIN